MASGRCGQRRHEHLRGGSLVSDRGMRPDGVVVPSSALDDDLRFPEGVEDLAIEKLITQAGIEALDEAILPWTASLE